MAAPIHQKTSYFHDLLDRKRCPSLTPFPCARGRPPNHRHRLARRQVVSFYLSPQLWGELNADKFLITKIYDFLSAVKKISKNYIDLYYMTHVI